MKAVILLSGLLMIIATECHKHRKDANVADTPLGKIRGSVMTSRLGKTIYSFRGIRYAEAPVGDLRFQPPVPVKSWTETLDATQEGPACPQPQWPPMENRSISEDCLQLNIYTTKLPARRPRGARPVIVFFHPSSFQIFSDQSFLYGPEYLLDQEIVLVTANYRLGALGFMSTGDSNAPGNLAFKDQVEVLRFVQKSISSFGGDPNSVTLAGDSSGSWSNCLHMVSPMSRGLFHRVIASSGSPIGSYALPHHQKDLAEKQANFVGCPTDSSENIIDCLKTKSSTEITDTLRLFFDAHRTSIELWEPVIEPEVPGVERFLTAQPVDLIRQGKFAKVPLIIGITKDEITALIIDYIESAKNGDTTVFDDFNANWTTIVPEIFLYESNTPRSYRISEEFRQFYLKGQPMSLDNVKGLGEMYADSLIFTAHRFAYLIAQYSDQPVYYYKFSYQGRYSWYTWPDNKPYGVSHMDDMMYLFYSSDQFPFFNADAPEIPTVKKMTAIWANFARLGQPIPRRNKDFAKVSWTPLTSENHAYMDINEKLEMKNGLYMERMNLWERLFPLDSLSKP